MAGAERESDHFLVRAKIRRNEKTKENETKEWPIGKLNKKEVKEEFIKGLTTNVQNIQLEEVKIQIKYGTKSKKEHMK